MPVLSRDCAVGQGPSRAGLLQISQTQAQAGFFAIGGGFVDDAGFGGFIKGGGDGAQGFGGFLAVAGVDESQVLFFQRVQA